MARADGSAAACWCESASFSPALLARVPAPLRGVSCVCASCADAASANALVEGPAR
jgi:hypothetical protein